MNLKKYAQYLVSKANGDIEFAKKVVLNDARISQYEGDEEASERSAKTFKILKSMEKASYKVRLFILGFLRCKRLSMSSLIPIPISSYNYFYSPTTIFIVIDSFINL
jgi:hypothetical protein